MNATEAAWRFVLDKGDAADCLVSVYCSKKSCEAVVAWVWETPQGQLVVSHHRTPRLRRPAETKDQEKRWASMGLGKVRGVCMGLLNDPACPPIRAGCSRHGTGTERSHFDWTMAEDGLAFVADRTSKTVRREGSVELDKLMLHRLALNAKANHRSFSERVHQLALR